MTTGLPSPTTLALRITSISVEGEFELSSNVANVCSAISHLISIDVERDFAAAGNDFKKLGHCRVGRDSRIDGGLVRRIGLANRHDIAAGGRVPAERRKIRRRSLCCKLRRRPFRPIPEADPVARGSLSDDGELDEPVFENSEG